MEKIEFIAEAKKRGYEEPEIQEMLEIYDQHIHDDYPLDLAFFFNTAISPDEIDALYAGTPAPAARA